MPRRWRRLALVVAVAAVALVVAIPLGRWERTHAASAQRAGIQQVLGAVGADLFGAALQGRAVVGRLECLLYRSGGYAYALELCFEGEGRLVRAEDARGAGDPVLWDVTFAPAFAPLRLADRDAAARALLLRARVGAATTQAYEEADNCRYALAAASGASAAELAPSRRRAAVASALRLCTVATRTIPAIRAEAAGWQVEGLDAALAAFADVASRQLAVARRAQADVASRGTASAATAARARAAAARLESAWRAARPLRARVGLLD